MRLPPATALLLTLSSRAVPAARALLESNAPQSPQILSDATDVCSAAQGRTSKCEVELDVPAACVSDGGTSDCPVVFFFHGAGGTNGGFARNSGVHEAGVIGVYPQGEDGWNTGPKSSNSCDWDDFDCSSDPDEGAFVAGIIERIRDIGANGNIYLNGNSNGAALAMRLAANAGDELPIKGIITKVTQLLASPSRSGPGTLNYNQPSTDGPVVSILNIMGMADGLIPYEGGSSAVFGGDNDFQLMSALESMATWATHDGCAAPQEGEVGYSTDADPDGVATFYEYECPEGTVVEHYAVHGAGHSFGPGAALDGTSIDYDLAYQFIRRLEGSGIDDPIDCVDDPGWRGKHSDAHDCAYVAVEPSARCVFEDSGGVPASEACPRTCDACDPPGPAPTPPPVGDGCVDDPAWRGKFDDGHDCAYVSVSPSVRCAFEDSDGTKASDACAETCGDCGAGPAPTPPTPSPVVPPGCRDEPDWHGKFNSAHDCGYVAQNPTARCGWVDADGKLAREACLVACDQC